MRRFGPVSVLASAVAALVALTACDGAATQSPAESEQVAAASFQPCPAAPSLAASVAATGGKLLPDLTLACFVGETSVALRGLSRPTVINLWASWCAPCRAELPEFQRLADRAGGAVAVLGVVTDDSRPAASSLAADLGVTFPTLFDASAELQHSVPTTALPVTLFVDASGVVRHVNLSGALSLSTLEELVRQHLGVALS